MKSYTTTALLSIASILAVIISGSSAQQGYNIQPQYNNGYQPQYQQQQQQVQYQQPQYQQQQQSQTAPQHPGKVTGYDAQDVIPQVVSPLKNIEESQGNGQYVDFINQLYRFDRTKTALNHRQKRAIIFRPLFVYKQQKVHREKVREQKDLNAAANARSSSSISANQSPQYKDSQNNVYREYNSFYEPYRYGQRYPYRF